MSRLHANARTCPHSRRLAVDRLELYGWTLAAAAEAARGERADDLEVAVPLSGRG
jgi:hypothetical protein